MKPHHRTLFSTGLLALTAVLAVTLSACRSVPAGEFFDDAIAIYASPAEVQALDGGALGAVPLGFAFAMDMEILPTPATPATSANPATPATPATPPTAPVPATSGVVGASVAPGPRDAPASAVASATTATLSSPVYVRSKAGVQGWVSRKALPQRLQRQIPAL